MGCLVGFVSSAAIAIIKRPFVSCASTRHSFGGFRAILNDEYDSFLQTAINGASLRFQETHRPEPLFLDPYAGCFVSSDVPKDMKQQPLLSTSSCHYCLATKFIDDKLLSTMNHLDDLRQIVLLTDGMDTRPYRLNWPKSTIIYDISPDRVFRIAAQKLGDVGAKIPRSCLFLHVPLESSDIQESLRRMGFNGNRPSIWVYQGLPVTTLANFGDILFIVGSLAAKGCIFLGEFPAWLADTETGIRNWMDRLFMSNGFRVNMTDFSEVAKNVGRDPPFVDSENLLFVAEQLRLSDDQMERWRGEFQRLEEEGDEEGFDEL